MLVGLAAGQPEGCRCVLVVVDVVDRESRRTDIGTGQHIQQVTDAETHGHALPRRIGGQRERMECSHPGVRRLPPHRRHAGERDVVVAGNLVEAQRRSRAGGGEELVAEGVVPGRGEQRVSLVEASDRTMPRAVSTV